MYLGLGMTSTQETIFAIAEAGIRVAMQLVVKKYAGEPPAKLRPMVVEAGLTAASLAGLDRKDPELIARINRMADALMPATAPPPPGTEEPPIPIIGKYGWKPILIAGAVVLGAYYLTREKK